ncbi:AI-2E family transporter [soil metagenome]
MQAKKPAVYSDTNYLTWLQYVVFGSVLLYFGREIFIPISFALLISFILYPICAWLEKKDIGRLAAVIISISLLVIVGLLLIALLVNQLVILFGEWPALKIKLYQSLQELSQMLINVFGISVEQQTDIISQISDQSGSNILLVLGNTISSSVFSAVLLILIPLYAVLILYYRQYWMKILYRLFPSESSENLRKVLSLTIKAYYNFIKGMALVYLIVGILNSIGLIIIGVPYAIFFGFIASILTFIPYIGILAGSLLPIAMAWITYDSFWYPVGIVAVFTFVQYLEANIIFPVAVSRRLNVNTLVMLLAIFTGGILWGVAGMILFVPFVGIAKLIADYNPRWKTISMILGMGNGKKKNVLKLDKKWHLKHSTSKNPSFDP